LPKIISANTKWKYCINFKDDDDDDDDDDGDVMYGIFLELWSSF